MAVGVRCPKCGGETTFRISKKDDCKFYVCINYPKCKGRIQYEEPQNEYEDGPRKKSWHGLLAPKDEYKGKSYKNLFESPEYREKTNHDNAIFLGAIIIIFIIIFVLYCIFS